MSRLDNSSGGLLLCYVTDRRSLSAFESAEQQELSSFASSDQRKLYSSESTALQELPLSAPTERQEILLRRIEAAAAASVDWIQIREKDLSGKDCALLTREALQRTTKLSPSAAAQKLSTSKRSPARILVNDRLDVAISQSAGGVHLGEKSLPIAEARRLVDSRAGGRDFLIGVSCHSLDGAKAAAAGGADYLFFGPVFATPSKTELGAPQGLQRLAEVCHAVSVPVLAIGGVTLTNSSACIAAGASGIAAIRLFQDARDLSSIVLALRKPKR